MSPTTDTAQGGHRLVIVESPAKAKTIKGYLGPGYVVEASVGHIRDLPNGAAEVPEKYTGEVRRLGVDVDNDFQPVYVVNSDKKSQVRKLKELLADADELLLATDEDREGEAIAWHLQEVLKPKVPVRRMVFHEITKDAIQAAVRNPRELDQLLVDAQETRRILDRLYGYEVSPVLWKKVMPRLSAGRVQSVATRLVVERERERIAFTLRRVLGPDRHVRHRPGRGPHRPRGVRRPALRGRRHAGRPGPGLRCVRPAQGRRAGAAPRRGRRPVAGRRARRQRLLGALGRVQAVPPLAVRAVPHHHAAAGGVAQARLRREGDHAGRPEAVRERLHHLHAYRLHHAVGDGGQRRPCPGHPVVRRGLPARSGRASTPARSRTRRRRTRRSGRPATGSAPRPRPA